MRLRRLSNWPTRVVRARALAPASALSCALLVLAGCGDDTASSGGPGGAANVGGGGVGGANGVTGTGGTTASGEGGTMPFAPEVIVPRTGITADELGVLVNDDDPLSVEVAEYYVAARNIPAANVVHLSIAATTASISQAEFGPLKTQVDAALASTDVQALAITWTKPYRVENMSITSAFSLGAKTIGDTCTDPSSQGGSKNPYVDDRSVTRPFEVLGFRPAMTIPATTFAEAQAIIDRGVASDDSWPMGSAYLMNTSDQTRSARCILNTMFGWTNECQALLDVWDSRGSGIAADIVSANSITGKTDVLFYVQGLAQVPDIDTNTYLPGAVADHLTSFGGQIPTSGQMSAFEFLLAGATGSYGTVVEPCAYTQKFPDPSLLVPHNFAGETLIEAYWKSVVWPAEGIFIGEPLARPFGSGFRTAYADGTLTIVTTTMIPGHTYRVEAADAPAGPFTPVVEDLSIPKYQIVTITIPNATRAVYRFGE